MTDKPAAPAPKPGAAERRAAFRQATIESFGASQTLVSRWSDEETLFEVSKTWRERAVAAAALIPAGARVLDLGCGDMKLEGLLPEGCAYLPLDVVRRDERTIVVDLNKQRLPPVEADVVVGLGLLEYLFDMPRVLRQLARQVPSAIFTYHPLNQSPARDRLSLCWVNALNLPELVAIVKHAGWKSVTVHQFRPAVVILEASRGAPKPT